MNKNTDEDSQLFREAMRNVRPLKASDKVIINQQKNVGNLTYRRKKAQSEALTLKTTVSISDIVKAEDVLVFAQSGLSKQQFQQLKNGQLTIDTELDLHGYTVDQSLLTLEQFFNQAREHQYRCLRIVHGKGREKALLKNATVAFLQAQNDILAYHSAPPFLGGTGATLVLLKR